MFAQYICSYLCYPSAARKQQLKVFSPSSRKLEMCTSDVQTMSRPQTWETRERAACNPALLHALQRESSAAARCSKRYSGISPRLRRMDIADTHVLCSAARRWERHTVNCRQNRKAESGEICILTATVHKSVKSHCHTRWYTENQERWGREYSKWRESDSGENWWVAEIIRGNISRKISLYMLAISHLICQSAPSLINCYEGLKLLYWHKSYPLQVV